MAIRLFCDLCETQILDNQPHYQVNISITSTTNNPHYDVGKQHVATAPGQNRYVELTPDIGMVCKECVSRIAVAIDDL